MGPNCRILQETPGSPLQIYRCNRQKEIQNTLSDYIDTVHHDPHENDAFEVLLRIHPKYIADMTAEKI